MTSALEGVVTRGTGRALDVGGRFGAIAGKTGTSNDWRDAWFVAYSSTLVVGVWVGFDDGRSLRMTGATAALPIVAGFLAQANPDDEPCEDEVPEWRVDRDWRDRFEARAERLLLRLLTGRRDPTGR
ncbi:MAG: hypothetical protein EXR94_09775 [Gemmatimonadetes bacterium]|nr:hypothetical protein [Gemmatimonadota bacterium]